MGLIKTKRGSSRISSGDRQRLTEERDRLFLDPNGESQLDFMLFLEYDDLWPMVDDQTEPAYPIADALYWDELPRFQIEINLTEARNIRTQRAVRDALGRSFDQVAKPE